MAWGSWIFWGLALAVPVGTSAWYFWQLSIKPRFIPRDKIKRMADELEARHRDEAEEVAFTNEDRAWRQSDTFEQGLWHRVRLELYRRRQG